MDDQNVRAQVREEIRKDAMKRVRNKIGFTWHLAAFVMVNIVLFVINMLTTPMLPWFLAPLAGWGIGLAFHGLAAFGMSNVKESLLEDEVDRELARRGHSRAR